MTKRNLGFFILLAIIIFSIYGNSLFNDFVWDDHYMIENNPYIKDAKYIKELVTTDAGVLAFREYRGAYRPLTMLFLLLEYKLFKLNTFGYHLINVLLHLANTILVFVLIHAITRRRTLSYICAVVFALHPSHSEAVCMAANNMGLIATMLAFTSFILYIKAVNVGRRIFLLYSSLAYFCALLSKEPVIMLPFFIVLYDLYFVVDFNLRRLVRRFAYWVPFLLSTLVYLTLRGIFIQDNPLNRWSALFNLENLGLHLYILTFFNIVISYIKMLIIPLNEAVEFVLYIAQPDIRSMFSVLTVIFLVILAYFFRRKTREASFFVSFFFISLIPYSLFFLFGARFSERYLYLPSISFCFLLSLGFLSLFEASKRIRSKLFRTEMLVAIIFGCILFFYGFRVIIRNYDWRNDLTLWSKASIACPECAKAHINLGYAYSNAGKYQEALFEFQIGLALAPNLSKAYLGISKVYWKLGDFDAGVGALKKALDLNDTDPAVHNKLGIAYSHLENFQDARASFEKAIDLWPDYADAYHNLGLLYYHRNDLPEALGYFQKTFELAPHDQNVKKSIDFINQRLKNENP